MCPAHGRERSPPAIALERIQLGLAPATSGMRPVQGKDLVTSDLAARCAPRADRSGSTRRSIRSLLTSDAERSG